MVSIFMWRVKGHWLVIPTSTDDLLVEKSQNLACKSLWDTGHCLELHNITQYKNPTWFHLTALSPATESMQNDLLTLDTSKGWPHKDIQKLPWKALSKTNDPEENLGNALDGYIKTTCNNVGLDSVPKEGCMARDRTDWKHLVARHLSPKLCWNVLGG